MSEEIRLTCLIIGIIMTQIGNILYFYELEKKIKELQKRELDKENK